MGLFNKEKLKDLAMKAKDELKDSFNEGVEKAKIEKEEKDRKQKEYKEIQDKYNSLFKPTKKMGDIEIDDINRLIKIHNASSNFKKKSGALKKTLAVSTMGMSTLAETIININDVIFTYDEIIDYELIENDSSVAKGGLSRAIVGGAITGGVGAIVGGVTGKKKSKKIIETLALQISTSDFNFPSIIITYVNKEMKANSNKYLDIFAKAKETTACLDIIFKSKENEDNVNKINSIDPYEEIKKAKELLDMGIITQEEFEQKKNKLLNL